MRFGVWLARYGAVFLAGFAKAQASASMLKLAPQPLQGPGCRLRQETEPNTSVATIYDIHIEAE